MEGREQPAVASLDEYVNSKEKCDFLWSKLLEAAQVVRTRRQRIYSGVRMMTTTKSIRRGRRSRLMKRRSRLERSRRAGGGGEIERKIRILKKLIPNCESMEMERLFRETADYIIALQMRVKIMQIMVNVLSPSASNQHEDDRDDN